MKSLITGLSAVCFFSGLSLLGFSARAQDFNGRWVATSGKYTDATGQVTPCTLIEVTMRQEPGRLTTERYRAECAGISTDWGPDPMVIQGEAVLNQEGRQIGTLKDGVLVTNEPIGSVVYAFNLQLDLSDPAHPVVKSLYGVRNFVGALNIEGVLSPAP